MAFPGYPPGSERIGARAREPQRGFTIGGCDISGTLAAGTTAYYYPYGSIDAVVLTAREMRISFNCVISELRANINAAVGVGETITFTLMVEGLASALTCQIGGAVDLEVEDLVNEIEVDEDDLLVMRVVTSGAANARTPSWSMKCVPRGN